MKRLFVLFAKVLGVSVVLQALVGFMPFLQMLHYTSASQMPELRTMFLVQTGFLVLAVAFGLGMIFYSGPFADLIGVSGPLETPEFSSGSFLRVGLVLIGVDYLLKYTPYVLGKLIAFEPSARRGFPVGDMVGIALALVLVFQAAHIAAYLEQADAPKDPA